MDTKTLLIIIACQLPTYIMFFFIYTQKEEKSKKSALLTRIATTIGMKHKAWVPCKDENRIFMGDEVEPYYD